MTRPHAADDFPAIRARMEELRRERAQASADDKPRSVSESRSDSGSSRPADDRVPSGQRRKGCAVINTKQRGLAFRHG